MKHNKKLLLEDITFPIGDDVDGYEMYLWDKNNNMICDFPYDTIKRGKIIKRIIGKYKTFNYETFSDNYIINDGKIIHRATGRVLLRVRGWGRLSRKDKPEERQDNILKYLLECIIRDEI